MSTLAALLCAVLIVTVAAGFWLARIASDQTVDNYLNFVRQVFTTIIRWFQR